MDIKKFTNLTEMVIRDHSLREQQKEEMLIQMADLHRFIKSYNASINLTDFQFQGKINVITDEGQKKGILFYDLKGLQDDKSYRLLISESKKKSGEVERIMAGFSKRKKLC